MGDLLQGHFWCRMGTNQIVLLQNSPISFKHYCLQIQVCCLELRLGRVILGGWWYLSSFSGKREVPVLCLSLGEEECFISVSTWEAHSGAFPFPSWQWELRAFHKKNKINPQIFGIVCFSPSDSPHLGRDTSNHGVTLELLTLEFYLNFISILFKFQLWDLI